MRGENNKILKKQVMNSFKSWEVKITKFLKKRTSKKQVMNSFKSWEVKITKISKKNKWVKQLKCWTQVFVKSLGEELEAQGCIFVASDQASSNMFMVHQQRKASAMIISKLHGTQVTPIFVQPTQRCSSDSFTNLEFRIY